MKYLTVKDVAEKWGYNEAIIRKWCQQGLILISILITLVGCSTPSNTYNSQIFYSINDYKEMMNNKLKQSDYSDYQIDEFENIKTENIGTETTKLEYNVYRSKIASETEIYLIESLTYHNIEQIRYKVELNSDDVTFTGFLLGSTMNILYEKNTDDEISEFYSNLQINYPIEGMNTVYEYKDNLYRATVKGGYLTLFITKSNFSITEEDLSNISDEEAIINDYGDEEIEDENNTSILKNSNGKDFFENVLCVVTGISSSECKKEDDEITYSGANIKYYIEVITNNENQIKSVRMTSFTNEDNTNFFMAATRLEYEGKDAGKATDYIIKNLNGDYNITYIGNAKFKLIPNSVGQTLEIISS